jgi:hypothetical protein
MSCKHGLSFGPHCTDDLIHASVGSPEAIVETRIRRIARRCRRPLPTRVPGSSGLRRLTCVRDKQVGYCLVAKAIHLHRLERDDSAACLVSAETEVAVRAQSAGHLLGNDTRSAPKRL